MENPIPGGCLCGAVRFEITGPPLWMACCHCRRCLKVGGTANVSVRADLRARTDDYGPHGRDTGYGFGIVDYSNGP